MKRTGTAALFKVLLRSFLIQGSFSAKYRQNLGFAFAIEPVGKRLYQNQNEYRAFVGRHIENYNGNPFMAPLVLGAVAHMEERFSSGDGISAEDITRFKKIIGPATGAIGDRLFWSNMRPFSLLIGIAGALLFGWWGTLLFIGAFNVPVLVLKLRWLSVGYRLGPQVVGELKHDMLVQAERVVETAGCVLAGMTALAVTTIFTKPAATPVETGGFLLIGILAIVLLKRGIQLYTVIMWTALVACAIGVAYIYVQNYML